MVLDEAIRAYTVYNNEDITDNIFADDNSDIHFSTSEWYETDESSDSNETYNSL